MTMDRTRTPVPPESREAALRDTSAPAFPRADGHVAVVLSILVTGAALSVLLARGFGLSPSLVALAAAAFTAAAIAGHVAISLRGSSQPRAPRSSGRAAARVPTPAERRRQVARLRDEALQADSGLAAEATPPPPQPPVWPPAPAEPPIAAKSSVLDETEVQRVERLVKQLVDNVRRVEAARGAEPASAAARASATPEARPSAAEMADDPTMQIAASISALKRAHAGPVDAAPSDDPADAERDGAGWAQHDEAAYAAPVVSAEAGGDDQTPTLDWTRHEVLKALNAQRIDVLLEPILDIAEQRPQHYEVSIALRTASGETIDLAHVERSLGGTGLLPLIDQTRIVQAAGLAERLAERGKSASVLTDVRGETIGDATFQGAFTGAGKRVGAFPGHLVLALAQADVALFATADWQTLARLRQAGFGFALTDVTSLDMDFSALVQRGFVMARLDAETFLVGLPTEGHVVAPDDICRHLSSCGLALVVGGIVDDHQLARIFGFGVLFGQGEVFGGRRVLRSSSPAGPASAPGDTSARPAAV